MSPAPDPPRASSWFRMQFRLGTVFWLILLTGMAIVWWKDRTDLDRRLRKMEQSNLAAQQPLWGAADILGAPNDPTGVEGKSWCPARTNAADWIEVGFEKSVDAATVDICETYSVGCVTEIAVIDRFGDQTTIWKGADPTPPNSRIGMFQAPVPKSINSIQRVKIHVDSTGTGSWACLDAVGLTTAAGKTIWAKSSSCSSVYGNGDLSASIEERSWFSFW